MNHLASYLKSHGITQAAFAEKLNVSQPTVNRWVKRLARPEWDKAAEIERITDGSVPVETWAREAAQ